MQTRFPVRKTYQQDFINTKWKILFSIEYKQATMLEYYEFLNKDKDEQILDLYKIIKEKIKYTFFDKVKLFFNKNYKSKIELWLNFENAFLSIMSNKFRTYESIFNKVKSRMQNKWWNKWTIDSVWLSMICKEYNISPTDLLNNYTLEQYFWFLDWIEWNNNALTKEWQSINNEAIKDTEAIKKRAEQTKKAFNKL